MSRVGLYHAETGDSQMGLLKLVRFLLHFTPERAWTNLLQVVALYERDE